MRTRSGIALRGGGGAMRPTGSAGRSAIISARIRTTTRSPGLRVSLRLRPVPSLLLPWHDRNRRDRILRRPLDDLVAYRHVDQRAAVLVDDAVDVRVLEKYRGFLGINRFLVGQFGDVD